MDLGILPRAGTAYLPNSSQTASAPGRQRGLVAVRSERAFAGLREAASRRRAAPYIIVHEDKPNQLYPSRVVPLRGRSGQPTRF